MFRHCRNAAYTLNWRNQVQSIFVAVFISKKNSKIAHAEYMIVALPHVKILHFPVLHVIIISSIVDAII